MFYDLFIALCREKGICPSRAVEAIGMNRASAVKWKNGTVPGGATLHKLAEYFGVSVDYLLGKTERREGGDLGVVSDEDIKFALFQGSGPVTDEMYAEVKRFAQFIQARQKEEE